MVKRFSVSLSCIPLSFDYNYSIAPLEQYSSILPSVSKMLQFLLPLLYITGTLSATIHHPSHSNCQSSLTSCPDNTIIVSPSNPLANYTTIQAAINSLPNDSTPQTILVLAGTYNEQLNITRAAPITLLGQTSHPNDPTRNRVTITWAAANHDNTGQSVDNVFSSVLVVSPTLNASLTGSGPTGFAVPEDTPFGNEDFRVYNVDFRNLWSEYSDGPAHALSFSRANGGFYACGFYSYQDTVCPFHSTTTIPIYYPT